MTESVTYTGTKASDKVECIGTHSFSVVDQNVFSVSSECKCCGLRTIKAAPAGVQLVDWVWLYRNDSKKMFYVKKAKKLASLIAAIEFEKAKRLSCNLAKLAVLQSQYEAVRSTTYNEG